MQSNLLSCWLCCYFGLIWTRCWPRHNLVLMKRKLVTLKHASRNNVIKVLTKMWRVSPMYRISLVWILSKQFTQVLVFYSTCQSALILFIFPCRCWATVSVQWNFGASFSLKHTLTWFFSFSHREIPVSQGHRGECTKCAIDAPLLALRKSQNSRILPAWLFWHQPKFLIIIIHLNEVYECSSEGNSEKLSLDGIFLLSWHCTIHIKVVFLRAVLLCLQW